MTSPGEELEFADELDPNTRDPEAPPPDAAEQARPANPAEEQSPPRRGLEVGEYDAVEQARVINLDDDDYR